MKLDMILKSLVMTKLAPQITKPLRKRFMTTGDVWTVIYYAGNIDMSALVCTLYNHTSSWNSLQIHTIDSL